MTTTKQICGLHAQIASSPYFSLWSRIEGFKTKDLSEMLYVEKKLVKMCGMRGTLHIISTEDFPIFHKALKRTINDRFRHFLQRCNWPVSIHEEQKIHQEIMRALENCSLTKKEIKQEVFDSHVVTSKVDSDLLLSRISRDMINKGLIVHAESLGSWYNFKQYKFARLDQWLPHIDLERYDELTAKRLLLMKYLCSYGPSSIADFAYWTGFPMREAVELFNSVKDELQEVKVDGVRNRFWIPNEQVTLLKEADVNESAPLRLLPSFDPLVMGHKDKSRIMKQEYARKVFLPLGNVAAVIMVDGMIAGVWKCERKKHEISFSVFPFRKLNDETTHQVRTTVERMTEFICLES